MILPEVFREFSFPIRSARASSASRIVPARRASTKRHGAREPERRYDVPDSWALRPGTIVARFRASFRRGRVLILPGPIRWKIRKIVGPSGDSRFPARSIAESQLRDYSATTI